MELNDEIDDFLHGKLQGEKLETFEKKLREDKEFADYVWKEVELMYGVMYANRLALQKKFEEIDQTNNTRTVIWRVAASISLVAVFGYILWFSLSKSQAEQVFLTYYEPITELNTPISRGNPTDPVLLDSAFSHYLQEEFPEAIVLLDKVSNQPPYQVYVNYLRSLISIAQEEYEDAIISLDLAAQQNSPIREDILWYRALCHIKRDDFEKATLDLKKLENSKYAEKARDVLDTL